MVPQSLQTVSCFLTYTIGLHVTSIDVLRKRQNAPTPCNEKLYQEDNQWIESAINALNCTPSFLKRFTQNLVASNTTLDNQVCTQRQYSNFKNLYSPESRFRKIASLYMQPCVEMRSTVSSTHSLISFNVTTVMRLIFKIGYEDEGYRETTNYRAFGLLSLGSQIGGFIGMFLGYSLLQVLDLIFVFVAFTKNTLTAYKCKHQDSAKNLPRQNLNDLKPTVDTSHRYSLIYRPEKRLSAYK